MSKDNKSPKGRSFSGGRREGDSSNRKASGERRPRRSDAGDSRSSDAPRRDSGTGASDKPFERRPFSNRGRSNDAGRSSYRDRDSSGSDSRSGDRPSYGDRRSSGSGDRPTRNYSSDGKSRSGRGPDPRQRDFEGRPKYDTSREGSHKGSGESRGGDRPWVDRRNSSEGGERKPYGDRSGSDRRSGGDRPWVDRRNSSEGGERKPYADRSGSDRRSGGDRPWVDRRNSSEGGERKPYGDRSGSDRRSSGDRPWVDRRNSSEGGERKPYGDRSGSDRRSSGDRPWVDRKNSSEGGERKPYGDRSGSDRRGGGDRPWKDRNASSEGGERKPYGDRSGSDRRSGGDRPWVDRRNSSEGGERKPYGDRSDSDRSSGGDRPWKDRTSASDSSARKPYADRRSNDSSFEEKRKGGSARGDSEFETTAPARRDREERVWTERKPFQEAEVITTAGPKSEREGKGPKIKPTKVTEDDGKSLRINQYLAHCGIASRREADEIIKKGEVTINGELVSTLGVRVVNGVDDVRWRGLRVVPQSEVYILLNKPKNTITTVDDPEGRKTVLDLVRGAAKGQRIYPVGRLDRNTTGLLLLTNDGDMADRLMHPSHKVRKLYHAKLDRAVTSEDLEKLLTGVELEDGLALADKVSYVDGTQGKEVGIEIHIGRNRVVRRMFEALGYEVKYLDRVGFAHLTKKDLPRGRWRYLSEKEVSFLKMV